MQQLFWIVHKIKGVGNLLVKNFQRSRLICKLVMRVQRGEPRRPYANETEKLGPKRQLLKILAKSGRVLNIEQNFGNFIAKSREPNDNVHHTMSAHKGEHTGNSFFVG